MRKLFWCGCAAVVVCAVGVYWVARWTEQYPQSRTASCARVAWRVAVEWNPIIQVGRALGGRLAGMVQPKEKQVARSQPEVVPVCPPDPGEKCPPPIVEVIDLSTFQGLRSAVEEALRGPDPMPQVETVFPGAIEEAEQAVPAVMPPADEDTPQAWPTRVERWMDLFRDSDEAGWKNAEDLPMPRVEDADEEDVEPQSAEQAAPEQLPMPSENGNARIIIKPEEEFAQTGVELTDVFGRPCGEAPEPLPELLPMPHEEAAEELPMPATDEGTVEESETIRPGPVPDCQEDPNMYQRYPECPMPSGCPGTKRCPSGAGLGKPRE
jgi:hypothetical protein